MAKNTKKTNNNNYPKISSKREDGQQIYEENINTKRKEDSTSMENTKEIGGKCESKVNFHPRYQYTYHRDFLLSCVCSTVGYGNLTRFPSLAAEHGGGSVVFVTLIYAVIVLIPMCCVEMFLGQLSGLGIGKTLGLMVPLFHGVGWAMVCVTFLQSINFTMHVTYYMFYFLKSVNDYFIWAECNNDWNSIEDERVCVPLKCVINVSPKNECAEYLNESTTGRVLPAEDFYYNHVLGYYPIANRGGFSLELVMSLLFSWCLIGCCLAFGIRISSKVAYVTVGFPYFVLLTLLITSLTFDGAADGVKAFFLPEHSNLASSKIWIDTLSAMFWSLNIGTGTITAMASYNPFHNNCKRDSIIIVLLDISTSFLAGITVFAGTGVVVNHMGNNVTVDFLQTYGRELGFVLYPEIISHLTETPTWAALFFMGVVIIGLDSEIWMAETVITEIADVYQSCRLGRYRVGLVVAFCSVSFIICLPLCIKGNGHYYLMLIGHAIHNYIIVLLALVEILVVLFVYGYNRFANDIRLILGNKPNLFWKIVFLLSAPITVFVLLLNYVLKLPTRKLRSETLSRSFHVSSVLITSVLASTILAFAIYKFIYSHRNKLPFASLIMPSKHWCPRKKSDLAKQQEEIQAAVEGIMGEFEMSKDSIEKCQRK